ncbi:unnamed protein product [Onchocerca flexuosa]|uniref:Ig-like domain-containing protein n=1 Tax=Onchocerca flexuosa TaxID=387005 RepID=A0A183HI55_9BILA|nr:unnamed protein product [Onchocerca flexuosa]
MALLLQMFRVLQTQCCTIARIIPNKPFQMLASLLSQIYLLAKDEGDYWCRRIDNKQEGEIARIVVAYVEQFPSNSRPTFHPASIYFGEHVTAHCPRTKAVPPAIYNWFLDGKAIDLSTERIIQTSNGSLQIQQFLRQDIGVYECVARNFAGRTSAKTYMNAITRLSNGIYLNNLLTFSRIFTRFIFHMHFSVQSLKTSISNSL